MNTLEINRPETVAEMQAVFARYEDALVSNDIAVLDELFWHDKAVVRYGATENLYGIEELRAFRSARSPVGLMRKLARTVITTFGSDFAVASTEFIREGQSAIGRQSQTWVRLPAGWRIVAAHVSLLQQPK
jgi:hypothetical protein